MRRAEATTLIRHGRWGGPVVLVAYQGEKGSYSEEAILSYFAALGMRGTETRPCTGFEEAVRLAESGEAHYAFLPIENTIEGTVDEALDALLASDLWIAGETRFKVNHCLIGHPGSDASSVKVAWSHPYALRQCRDFLRAHSIEGRPSGDTAGAVREVKSRGNIMEAAIGSEEAAAVHGMVVLQKGIQSRQHNYTRFVALSRSEYKPNPARKQRYLTTVVLGIRHAPGALHAALGEFAKRDLNLTKLESRPRPDKPWSYEFLIDLEGHKDDEDVAAALSSVVNVAASLRVLGSYPSWASVEETARPARAAL